MLVLLLVISLLSGCAGTGGSGTEGLQGTQGQQASVQGAMGRYMETVYAFPEELNRNGGVNWMDDGSLTVISYGSGLYRSLDEGETWQAEETAWYPMIQNVYCLAAVMGPDGTVAATCSGAMPEAARAVYESELPEDWEGNYCVFALPDGTIKIVDFGFSQEDATCLSSLVFKEDGRLFAGDFTGRVYEVDIEKEHVTELFAADREVGYLDFSEEILMAVGYDRLYLYDLSQEVLLSQDETVDAFIRQRLSDGTVAYTGGGYPLAVMGSNEPDVIYLACADGMYRHVLHGSVMEQVIDGALTTFGDSHASIYRMRPLENQEFLVSFSPSAGLVRYIFNEDVPAMPDREIRIYSLTENGSVRQAVTAYKKDHTDLYVRYEVGLQEDSGMTVEDAAKRLNTQVLAEEGPDVLILDGLPLDTYMEKGMLLDMRSIFEKREGDDTLFEQVVQGFTQADGAVYAMPMGIRVPLLVGAKETIAKVHDLQSLAEQVTALRDTHPEGGLFGIYDAKTFLRLFGMVSSPAWIDEEGQMDSEAVTEFLTLTKQMYDTELAGAIPEQQERLRIEEEEMASYGMDVETYRRQISNNVLYLPMGYAMLSAGYTEGIQLDLDNVTSVIRAQEGLSYQVFEGQRSGLFYPAAMVGISAKSEQSEDAVEFVRMMFTKESQEEVYEGFPINRAAFASRLAFYEENDSNGTMTLQKADGSEEDLELYWPNQEEREQFIACVESLTTPVVTSDYLCELVYEEGVKVLEGETSAEAAAAEIVKKAAIFLAE